MRQEGIMINYEMIKNLTDEDVAKLSEFRPIAKEAEEAERMIRETWLFKSCQDTIKVWESDDGCVKEYMGYDGRWRRDVAGEGYSIVDCEAKEIFDYFKAEWLFKNYCGCVREDDDETAKMAEVCSHFREFLKRTEEKHSKIAVKS